MPHARGNLLKCREPSRSRAPAYATFVVMGAAFVFSMAMCWPGHLSYDSLVQLLEGRRGLYSGWHPPAMSWLLGLSDQIAPAAGLFVAANALIFFGSLLSLLWIVPRPGWAAPAIAALCALTPQFALYQGTVWKDVLFANATVAGFVVQAHLAQSWAPSARRYSLLALSFSLLVLATLTRQNGGIVLLAGAVSCGWIAARMSTSWRQATILSGGALALSILASIAATAALNTRLVPDAGLSRQIKRLELYDLIGGLAADRKLTLPDLRRGDPELLRLMRSDGVRLYTPVRSDTLVQSAPLQAALARAPDTTLQDAWLSFIVRHPGDYLLARWKAFAWVTFTPDISLCVPYVVGQRGPPQTMEALGLRTRMNRRDEWADAYGKLFLHTPVFSHVSFLLLSLGELAFLLWRRRIPDLAFVGLIGGAMLFAGSFYMIAFACDYRYDYLLDLAAMVTLIYISLDPALLSENGAEGGSAPSWAGAGGNRTPLSLP